MKLFWLLFLQNQYRKTQKGMRLTYQPMKEDTVCSKR
jgi:hypothetical protein